MKKISFAFLFLLASSCAKVDTDPCALFSEIQSDISYRTGDTIYWEQDCFTTSCLEEDLKEETAVQIALIHNRRLLSVYENLGIGKAELAQAGLLKNPLLPFSYLFSLKSKISDLIDIGLFQNFLEILLIPMKKRIAEKELEATKAFVKSQILDVIYETRMWFLTLQANEQVWEVAKKELLAAELTFEAAKRMVEAGNLWNLELSDFRMQYEEMKIAVAEREMHVIEAKEKLNQVMGLWGCAVDWSYCSCLPEIPCAEEEPIDIENRAVCQNMELEVAYQDLLATAARFGVDTSRLIAPQLDLGAGSEREDGVWYLGPAFVLPIPLFDWGRANAALAKAEISRKFHDYQALATNLRSHARLARFEYLNSLRQIRYYHHVIVPLAEQITNLTHLQYNAMQLGVFSLLTAKQNELQKKSVSILKEKNYWISKLDLDMLIIGYDRRGKHP